MEKIAVFRHLVFSSDSRKSDYFGPKAHGMAQRIGPQLRSALVSTCWSTGLAQPLASLPGVGTAG